jgi:hypothetical protein
MDPTFQNILHLLAWNGYEDEAYKGSQVCKETWEDKRILLPRLINKQLGKGKRTLLSINCLCILNEAYSLQRIKRLISLGANPDAPNGRNGFTPLMELCLHGDSYKMEIFAYIVQQKVLLDGSDKLTWCPLSLLATKPNTMKKMQLLLNQGANINRLSSSGSSVLYNACSLGDLAYLGETENIDFLCRHGADVEKNSHGSTPLSLCLREHKVACAKVLVAHGARIPEDAMTRALDIMHHESMGAMHRETIGKRTRETVRFLFECGFPIPESTLEDAVNHRDSEKVKFLLDCNVPVHGGKYIVNLLQREIGGVSTVRIVKYLCQAGADVNQEAPIHSFHAKIMAYTTVVEPVIYHIVRDYISYQNPYALDIIELLVQHGAISPPESEYTHMIQFSSNPFKFASLIAILRRGRK